MMDREDLAVYFGELVDMTGPELEAHIEQQRADFEELVADGVANILAMIDNS